MRKNTLDDQKLLKLLNKDASRGMQELMDYYSGLIYYIVEGKLHGKTQDIEECVEDVFIEFYNKIDQIDLNKGSIKGYLSMMATRRAIDKYRKIASVMEQGMEALEATADDCSYEPENVTVEDERNKAILTAIKNLGEPDNEILYRRYYLSQPVKEIAEALDMKSNSVTKRITRALSTLKGRLEEYHYE